MATIRNVLTVISPRHPISTSTRRAICPAKENSEAMSTTVSPVTQTAEHAVKADVTSGPHAPSLRAQGLASTTAPMAISARKPSATENLPFMRAP